MSERFVGRLSLAERLRCLLFSRVSVVYMYVVIPADRLASVTAETAGLFNYPKDAKVSEK